MKEGILERYRARPARARRIPRRVSIPLGILALLLAAGVVADRALDEPLRRSMVSQINARLDGYTAEIGHLDFHVVGLSVELQDLVLVQNAHPDPPVLHVEELDASVLWRALLRLRLVADFTLWSPSLYVNLVQLQEENRDAVPIDDRGWQDALLAIYPLKIDELAIHDGRLVYTDDAGFRPLQASRLEVTATNIRNIRSPERTYPSPVRVEGRLFDAGTLRVEGHADFLAKPHAGIAAAVELSGIELDYFEPMTERYGLEVEQGLLAARGKMEFAPGVRVAALDAVDISDAAVDYHYGAGADARARGVARQVSATARQVMNEEEYLVRIDRLSMRGATIGLVNHAASPVYRLHLDGASLELENLSSRTSDGPAVARVRASFMGSGKVDATATSTSSRASRRSTPTSACGTGGSRAT